MRDYFLPLDPPLPLPCVWDKALAAADFSAFVDLGLLGTLLAALAAFFPVCLLCAILALLLEGSRIPMSSRWHKGATGHGIFS